MAAKKKAPAKSRKSTNRNSDYDNVKFGRGAADTDHLAKVANQARSRASKIGQPTGKTVVVGDNWITNKDITGRITSQTPVRKVTARGKNPSVTKGKVTEVKTEIFMAPDRRKTTVKWDRGRGGKTKKK